MGFPLERVARIAEKVGKDDKKVAFALADARINHPD